ncbi:MAG: ArsB/NhaD family transporter, partial [Chloroflexota bacterium]
LVALAGGGLLLLGSAYFGALDLLRVVRGISWSIFPFIAGMFVVIQGVSNSGLSALLGAALLGLAHTSRLAGILGAAFSVGLVSNAVNNLPAAVLMISALHSGPSSSVLLFGGLLGADAGPCLSITGSLAGILWLIILRRRGLDLSGWQYLKYGAFVTPPLLLAGSLVLWLTVRP